MSDFSAFQSASKTDTPIMETQAGDAGAFAQFDLTRVPSPCFVVDVAKIRHNLAILANVAEHSGATILAALKAFSMWSLAPEIAHSLSGSCASGLWEARLGRAHYGGELATFAAGYKADEIKEIIALSDHIIFNTPQQKNRFMPQIQAARAAGKSIHVGLRINPEHSEGSIAKYDPCAAGSRLGTPISQLDDAAMQGVNGLHMHTLCEQNFAPLKRTWQVILPQIQPWLAQLDWLNLGGGHHITRADYERDALTAFIKALRNETNCQIYLEPGEAIALDAGILVGEVLDTMQNNGTIAILDISATCHMPDVIEAPYRPALLNEGGDNIIRLGGPSCLAGDVIGEYAFPEIPQIGQRLAFLDQAHYSMVKTTCFNGVRLPSIAIWDSETDRLHIQRRFTYDDFKGRLS